ncbi:MAG TPA: D-glucuronyl C5-epimerase family protein [Gaiellaceae bacterium]|nr:D-glucuronyl C5-epimerase family protein [Gaiellaceae bacterium]
MKSVRGLAVLYAAVAALVLAGSAPASSVTHLEKVVLAKIQRARASGRIDASTAAQARSEVARAAHLIRTLPNGRGYHVQVALTEVASFDEALTLPRALELFGALRANDDYFARHWAPADKTDIVAADGVVYRYFGGYCFRFHPLANFGVLNARAVAGDVDGTRELADALLERGVYQRGGGIAWEYDFPFGGGRAPWLSGMAQAVAAQAFARAAALVPDRATAYLREAAAAYRVIPRHLLTTVAAGPWIKLYSFSSLAVLNADLQATISLGDYASSSDDSSAAALAKRLQNAAAAMLPHFDTGYWTYYSLAGDPSPPDYQAFVVSLLKKLGPSDPRFAAAATRFASYQHQPPAFQLANAGVGQVRFWLSKPATVTATTSAGPTKRLALLDGWHTLTWSPKNAGVFPVHVAATDWAGNTSSFDPLPIVRIGAAAAKAGARSTSDAGATGPPSFVVGAALDDPSQSTLAQSLGLRLVRIGVAWPTGATAPDPSLVAALAKVPPSIGLLVELNGGTPAPPDALAQYAASLAQQVPNLKYLVLTPSPTAPTAAAYAGTLAAVRDAVHAVAPAVSVGPLVDGSLQPKPTVAALGAAGAPADVLAFRPAPAVATGQWTLPNVAAITKAFGTLPPLLLDGVAEAAAVPAANASSYPAGTVLTGTDPATQASDYASDIATSSCSPTIVGVVFDRLVDSATTPTSPTGLYYPDGTPKPAAAAVATAATAAQRGTTVCPGLATPAAPTTLTFPTSVSSGTAVTLQLGCARDCLYVATLVGADGRPVVARRGSLRGGAVPATVTLPQTSLGQSSYTLDVRLASRVNPGPLVTETSPPIPRD